MFGISALAGRLVLILVEAGLETVPEEVADHPAVRSYAEKRGKRPTQVLLDRSYHHWAMKNLKHAEKRGRPDIVHFCLLEALGSPLNAEGLLETYVSTLGGHVVYVNSSVRLPRVYDRFKGLFEQLFERGVIKSSSGEQLLRLEKMGLEELLSKLKPSVKVLMGEKGRLVGMSETSSLFEAARPAFMVGAFPHGDFSPETRMLADVELSISTIPLEAWTVVSRLLCWGEHALLGKT